MSAKTIFEKSRAGRGTRYVDDRGWNERTGRIASRPGRAGSTAPALPEVTEGQVVRHYTNLSRKNWGVDVGFYPLGSCTMKYNPRFERADRLLARVRGDAPAAAGAGGAGLAARAVRDRAHCSPTCAAWRASPSSRRRARRASCAGC